MSSTNFTRLLLPQGSRPLFSRAGSIIARRLQQLQPSPPITARLATDRALTTLRRPSPHHWPFRSSTNLPTPRVRSAASSSTSSSPSQQPTDTPRADATSGDLSAEDARLLDGISNSWTEQPDRPTFALLMTCKRCKERSAHNVSRQGMTAGTVLVQCPGCKNRHLLADHLEIFSEKKMALEDILADNGDSPRKFVASRNQTGDVEILDSKSPSVS